MVDFDDVIADAGAAGCVLASRLSADPGSRAAGCFCGGAATVMRAPCFMCRRGAVSRGGENPAKSWTGRSSPGQDGGVRHSVGLLDCLMWPAGMVTTTITVTALQGHHAGLEGEVIAAVTLANLVGSSRCGQAGQAVHPGAA